MLQANNRQQVHGQQLTINRCAKIYATPKLTVGNIQPDTPIENALCWCQFAVKWGKKYGIHLFDIDPNERVLSYQVLDVCAKFHQNPLKIATVRARTDRHTHGHTHTHRDDRGDLIICPMLCYSNGTDNNDIRCGRAWLWHLTVVAGRVQVILLHA